MLASRKKIYSVGFEISVENFSRKRIRKISQELPNHRRTCAAFTQQSQFKRSTWTGGPQAVLKYSCLDNTLWKSGVHRCSGQEFSNEPRARSRFGALLETYRHRTGPAACSPGGARAIVI